MGRGPSPLSLPTATDLERPGPVGLLPAKVELSSHRQAHKEPVAEAEVVDEQEDILHSEVDECHGALEGEGGSRRQQCHQQGDVTPRESSIQQSAPDLLTANLASPDYLRFSSVVPWPQKGPLSTLTFKVVPLLYLLGGPSSTQCLSSFCKHFSNKSNSFPLLMADSEALLISATKLNMNHKVPSRSLHMGPTFLAYKWPNASRTSSLVLAP